MNLCGRIVEHLATIPALLAAAAHHEVCGQIAAEARDN